MSADIERIDAVVGKFVEYARATGSAESRHPDVGPVDVAALLASVRATYRGAVESGNLEIVTEVPPGLHWNGDPTDLARVLGNLLENALRHGRLPGQPAQVLVRCERSERGRGSGRRSRTRRPARSDRRSGAPVRATRQRTRRRRRKRARSGDRGSHCAPLSRPLHAGAGLRGRAVGAGGIARRRGLIDQDNQSHMNDQLVNSIGGE